MKKYFCFLSVLIIVFNFFIYTPHYAFAITIDQLNAKVEGLERQMNEIKASIKPGIVKGVSFETPMLFTQDLFTGTKEKLQVKKLQELLKSEGYFNSQITGQFGTITLSAVKLFQKENNLPATGYVGSATRVILNGPSYLGFCQGITQPTIQLKKPNGGETNYAGHLLKINWKTCLIGSNDIVNITIAGNTKLGNFASPGITEADGIIWSGSSINDGVENIRLPQNVPPGAYKAYLKTLEASDVSDDYFNIKNNLTCNQNINSPVLLGETQQIFQPISVHLGQTNINFSTINIASCYGNSVLSGLSFNFDPQNTNINFDSISVYRGSIMLGTITSPGVGLSTLSSPISIPAGQSVTLILKANVSSSASLGSLNLLSSISSNTNPLISLSLNKLQTLNILP